MAEIKSALEIALEKTQGLQVDKEKIRLKEYKIMGRKEALSFIDNTLTAKNFAKNIKQFKGKEKEAYICGAGERFIAYIKLPADESYKQEFLKAAEGFGILTESPKEMKQMFSQLEQFIDQFIINKQQLKNQLDSQFAPILQQKEEAYAAQTGQRIKIDPMDDPDYQQAYVENIKRLESNYLESLNQAKAQLKELIGIREG